jgi:hypothetical protein
VNIPAILCTGPVLCNYSANLFVSDGNEFWSKKERIPFSTAKPLAVIFRGTTEKMIMMESGGCGKALKCVINRRNQLNMKIMNFLLGPTEIVNN